MRENHRAQSYAFILICFLIASLVLPGRADAQEPASLTIPFAQLTGGEPLALTGFNSSASLALPVPNGLKIAEEARLDLLISASEMLDMQASSLTVFMNDTMLVASVRLENLTSGLYSVKIPATMFRATQNSLKLLARLYFTGEQGGECRDWNDPARWLSIDPQSTLYLTVTESTLDLGLEHFPLPFTIPNGSEPLLFVLPDQPTDEDLTTFAAINYVFGQAGVEPFAWQPLVIGQSQLDAQSAAGYNMVAVVNSQAGFLDIAPFDKDFIQLTSSPWDANKAVLILGDHVAGDHANPVYALAEPDRSILLSGSKAYIDNLEIASAYSLPQQFTFADLGYDERTARGFGVQSLIYRVYLPYDREIVSADIELVISHSPALAEEQSVATVYLNGYAVAGVLLSAHSANLEPIKISLPASSFRPGINFLRFSFDMQLPHNFCRELSETLWATIHNTTRLSLPTRLAEPPPDMRHFPQPFSGLSGALLVIPDQLDSSTLQNIARLSALLGGNAYAGSAPPRLVRASAFDPQAVEDLYVIVVGTPQQNSVVMQLNPYLPQPFTPDGMFLQAGYGVRLPDQDQYPSLGVIQLVTSPWKEGGRILLLSATDADGLQRAWDLLLEAERSAELKGNLILVGPEKSSLSHVVPQDENRTSVSAQTAQDVGRIPVIGALLQRVPQPVWLSAGAILAALLILVAFALLTRRRLKPLHFRLPDFLQRRKRDDVE